MTLDVWGTVQGGIDGAIEVSPGSSIRSDEARELVARELRHLLDPDGRFRRRHSKVIGGIERPGLPDEVLDSPTCVLTMAWDEQRRLISGPGYGPLSNDRTAPASIRPLRDLIEWTLTAVSTRFDTQ